MQPVVNLPSTCSFQPTPNNILPYNSMNQQSTTAAHLPLLSHSTVQKTADWSNAYLQQQSYLRNSYPPNLMNNYSFYQQSSVANLPAHLQATSSINRTSTICKTPSTADKHKTTKLPQQKEQSTGLRVNMHHKRCGDKIFRSPSMDHKHKRRKLTSSKEKLGESRNASTSCHHKKRGDKISRSLSTDHKHKRRKLTPLRKLEETRSTSRHHKRRGDEICRFSRDKIHLNKSKTRGRSRDDDLRSVIRSVRRKRSISQLKDSCKDTRPSDYKKKCRLSPSKIKDYKVHQKSDNRRTSDRHKSSNIQGRISKRKYESLSSRDSSNVRRRHVEQDRTNGRLKNDRHSNSQNHSSKRKVEFSKSRLHRK